MLDFFVDLDDNDILMSLKYWQHLDYPILSDLCRRFLNRNFFRTSFLDKKPKEKQLTDWRNKTAAILEGMGLPSDPDSVDCYLFHDFSQSEAYTSQSGGIWILQNDDVAIEFSKASDNQHILALTKPVIKHYVVHLKDLSLDV